MTAQSWIAIVTIGAAVFLIATAPKSAPDSTSGDASTPGDGPASPGSLLARAIAFAEGFGADPDNVPTRANNPGDLKLAGHPTTGAEGITVFASLADGWAALDHQLGLIRSGVSHVYTRAMSIGDMAGRWTYTESDTWAANVVDYLRAHGAPDATVDTPLDQVLA